MRHRVRGRHLGRTPSHRKAMFRNMAVSLIRSVRPETYPSGGEPKVAGRIVTTVAKAKELRPFIEKLITMARKSIALQQQANDLNSTADKNSAEWKSWRDSDKWNQWNQAQAPVLALRRRAFSLLRDNEAVDILFDELATRFEDRPGGYTRVLKLATPRLGDGGAQALIEFVGGERDRVKVKRSAPVVAPEVISEETSVEDAPAEEVAESSATETAEAETAETPAEDENKAAE